MDKSSSKPLKNFEFLVLQLFTTKKWEGTNSKRKNAEKNQLLGMKKIRSYWIPGSYAPALSEKGNSFLRLLKNKGFREESMTKVGVDAIGTSTTLESNKSLRPIPLSS
jgi:hypothetical protein